MRIAKVIGTVTLSQRQQNLKVAGRLLLAEMQDHAALAGGKRETPMPQSLVVYDDLGAGEGELIAITEGGEATAPFYPDRVPCDAYCAAILDSVTIDT